MVPGLTPSPGESLGVNGSLNIRVVGVSLVPTDVGARVKWWVVNLSCGNGGYFRATFMVKWEQIPRPPTDAVPFVVVAWLGVVFCDWCGVSGFGGSFSVRTSLGMSVVSLSASSRLVG